MPEGKKDSPKPSRQLKGSSEVFPSNPSPTPNLSDEEDERDEGKRAGPSKKLVIDPEVVMAVIYETFESALTHSESLFDQRTPPDDFLTAVSSVIALRRECSFHEATTSGRFCRICHEVDSAEKYISPCWCKGSLSCVHRSCLERWLAESDSSHCELCSYVYVTRREPRHRMIPSIIFYLKSPDTRRQRRTLVMDILICTATFPMATVGTYLGVLLADGMNNPNAVIPSEVPMSLSSKVMTILIVSIMTTMDFAYVSWLLFRLQYHVAQWYSWYRKNSKVTLIYTMETEGEEE